MKIYIAGPMRGCPNWNFEAFDRAKIVWERGGHQVFSPAGVDRALGYSQGQHENNHTGLRHVITMDVACICASDYIGLLSGWEHSSGATVEVALAQFLDLPVYDAITMEKISLDVNPWGHLRGRISEQS